MIFPPSLNITITKLPSSDNTRYYIHSGYREAVRCAYTPPGPDICCRVIMCDIAAGETNHGIQASRTLWICVCSSRIDTAFSSSRQEPEQADSCHGLSLRLSEAQGRHGVRDQLVVDSSQSPCKAVCAVRPTRLKCAELLTSLKPRPGPKMISLP